MRACAHLLLRALLAGLGLAAAAAWLSAVGSTHTTQFLLVWGVFFSLLAMLAGLLAMPLGLIVAGALPRSRRGIWGLGEGLLHGLLLGMFVPVVRALGGWAAIACGVAGLLAWQLLPPARAEGKPLARKPLMAASLPLLLVWGGLAWWNPEGRYAQRYQENLLPAGLDLDAAHAVTEPDALTDRELARAIAHTFMEVHPQAQLRWSWEEAVAVTGLQAYGRATGDSLAFSYTRAWIDAHCEQALSEPLWADAGAPFLAVLELPPSYRRPADSLLLGRLESYLRRDAPRTSRGTYSHAGLLLAGWLPPAAWVDSLVMHGLPLNRWDAVWAQEQAELLGTSMLAALQDDGSGLLRHAAFELAGHELLLPVEDMFWARGNAWALVFLVDQLADAESSRRPARQELRQGLQRLAAGLLTQQDAASGLWRSDLGGDPAGNPLETSASALIASALERGAARGLLEAEPARAAAARARRGLRQLLQWQQGRPLLPNTSTGTHPGFRAYYRAVPMASNVSHGVGAMLLLLCPEE